MGCRATVRLGDVIRLEDAKREPISARQRAERKGIYPYFGAQGVVDHLNDYTYEGEYLLVAEDGENLRSRKQPIANAASGRFRVNNHAHVLGGTEKCNLIYLLHLLNSTDISGYVTGSTQPKLSQSNLLDITVALPDIDTQNAIASLLNSFDKKISLNNQLNGYLAALGETMATRCSNETDGTLDDICSQSKETVSLEAAQLETYVSTENLLPNKAGLQLSAGLPTSGKVTRYRKGDTLVANIRPYFKKIWYATDEGTCSGDVIVFRANDARYAPYVFFSLCRDEFFEYVMLGAKGTKMPRGDKKQMMTFPICTNCNSTDLQLLHELASMIGTNHAESRQLMRLRDILLPKLMSGEIDVSKVDLTQLNSHLAQIRKLNDTPLATTDLGFRFDRSHYTPLLYNPSSSQQQ